MPNCTRVFVGQISLNPSHSSRMISPTPFIFLSEWGTVFKFKRVTCLKSHQWKVAGSRFKPRSLWLQSQCSNTTPHCPGVFSVEKQKLQLHFNLLNHIPLHFKRFCVNDCSKSLSGKEGYWRSSTKSVAQTSSSCAGANGHVTCMPGQGCMCVCLRLGIFKRHEEPRRQEDGRESLVFNSAKC